MEKEETNQKYMDEKNYDRAITLIQNQVQLLWLVFSAFLITETVLLTGLVSIANEGSRLVMFFCAIFGFIISILWYKSFQYNHTFYLLRIAEAKHLEPAHGFFFQNGQDLKDGKKTLGISMPTDAGSPKKAVSLLILLFAFAFLCIAIINIPFYCFSCNRGPN